MKTIGVKSELEILLDKKENEINYFVDEYKNNPQLKQTHYKERDKIKADLETACLRIKKLKRLLKD